MPDFDRAMMPLEYDKICDRLADCAHTEGARGLALRLHPSDDPDFVRRAQSRYKVYEAYCDSAEQALIAGFESAVIHEHIVIEIKNAIKGSINDRIAFYNSLIAQHRWKVMRHCTHIIAAFEEAVYDEKKKSMDVRLDDGEMNVDSLDSTEYSTENVQEDILYIAA